MFVCGVPELRSTQQFCLTARGKLRSRELCPCPESHSRWAVNCPTVSSPSCPSWDGQSLLCRSDQGSVKVTLPKEIKVEFHATMLGLAAQRTTAGDTCYLGALRPEVWKDVGTVGVICGFQEESVHCLSHSVLASDHLLWLADVCLWYLTPCALVCCSLPWLYLSLPFTWARKEHSTRNYATSARPLVTRK